MPRNVDRRLVVMLAAMLAAGLVAFWGVRHLLNGGTVDHHTGQSGTAGTSSGASGAAVDFTSYVGLWSSHAAALTITAERTGSLDWRGYGPGCLGANRCAGHATIRFAVTGTAVTGSITSSTRDTEYPAGATVTIRTAAGDTLELTVDGQPGPLLFCGPDAEPGTCGA